VRLDVLDRGDQRHLHVRNGGWHLMHSGRRRSTDMFGGGGGAALGSTSAERNLTRITTVLALIWIFTVVSLGFLLVRF
jgi:preprotein translocase subunit SecG